jgi:DNA-binding MarR family transcriptional regulator
VSESDLTERLTVPTTVLIRWMKMLEAQNLISRAVDSADASKVRVELTARGLASMEGYFSDSD